MVTEEFISKSKVRILYCILTSILLLRLWELFSGSLSTLFYDDLYILCSIQYDRGIWPYFLKNSENLFRTNIYLEGMPPLEIIWGGLYKLGFSFTKFIKPFNFVICHAAGILGAWWLGKKVLKDKVATLYFLSLLLCHSSFLYSVISPTGKGVAFLISIFMLCFVIREGALSSFAIFALSLFSFHLLPMGVLGLTILFWKERKKTQLLLLSLLSFITIFKVFNLFSEKDIFEPELFDLSLIRFFGLGFSYESYVIESFALFIGIFLFLPFFLYGMYKLRKEKLYPLLIIPFGGFFLMKVLLEGSFKLTNVPYLPLIGILCFVMGLKVLSKRFPHIATIVAFFWLSYSLVMTAQRELSLFYYRSIKLKEKTSMTSYRVNDIENLLSFLKKDRRETYYFSSDSCFMKPFLQLHGLENVHLFNPENHKLSEINNFLDFEDISYDKNVKLFRKELLNGRSWTEIKSEKGLSFSYKIYEVNP